MREVSCDLATADTVNDGFPGFTSGLAPGQTFTGTFTFESSTPDANSDPTIGDYQNALLGITIVFPDGVLSVPAGFVSGSTSYTVANDIGVTVPDSYGWNYVELGCPLCSTYNGEALSQSLLEVFSVGASVADDSLVTDPSVLGTESMYKIELVRATDLATIQIFGIHVNSVFAVPEPGGLALAASGMALLAPWRGGIRRRARTA